MIIYLNFGKVMKKVKSNVSRAASKRSDSINMDKFAGSSEESDHSDEYSGDHSGGSNEAKSGEEGDSEPEGEEEEDGEKEEEEDSQSGVGVDPSDGEGIASNTDDSEDELTGKNF
jgi:hypothetical protein